MKNSKHIVFVAAIAAMVLCAGQVALAGSDGVKPEIVQQMQCGSHKVVITCGKAKPGEVDVGGSRVCLHNKLKFIDAAGKVKIVPGFGGKKRNPESMDCGVGKDGRHYVQVLVYYCDWPSCGELALLTEDGVEIASRAIRSDDNDSLRRYEKLRRENRIRFPRDSGQ